MYLRLGFQNRSHIEVQLSKEDCTLEDLLEEDDVVQEAKSQNSKLINFLSTKETLTKIAQYVSNEQKLKEKNEEEEETQYTKAVHKYPQICCDILCSDSDILYDAVVSEDKIMTIIFSYLSTTEHVYSNFLSNWLKLVTRLFEKRPKEVLKFVQEHEEIVGYFTNHFGYVEILELLLRFLGLESIEEEQDNSFQNLNIGFGQLMKKNEKKVLDFDSFEVSKKFIEQIIDKMDTKYEPEIHTNVTYIFAEILLRSTKNQSEKINPLAYHLLSKDIINSYCQTLIKNPNTSIMTEGIALLSYIIEVSFSVMIKEKKTDLPDSIQVILDTLPELSQLLTNPPKMDVVETTFAKLDPPLGLSRLKIIEFLIQLFRINSTIVETYLKKNNILGIILDLVFFYEYNNLLHNLFLTLMTFILGGESVEIKKALFLDYKICDKIILLFKENKEQIEKTRMGKGFMGHLTITANTIESVSKSQKLIESFVKDHKEWNEFVSKDLAQRNSLEIQDFGSDQKEDIEKQFQDFEQDEEFGDDDFKKTNDDSDDEDDFKKTNNDSDSDDETMVRHKDDDNDVQTHDPKFLNSFTVWRLENEITVENELK